MKTKKEIKRWLLKNAVDERGNLDLRELDLSDFDGDVDISWMKVKKDLYQSYQKVEGDLWQSNQKVEDTLYQHDQKVGKKLLQNFQEVGGDLFQNCQKVEGYAHVGNNEFAGIKEWDEEEGILKITKELDPYKDVSREDLIKEIERLKEQ